MLLSPAVFFVSLLAVVRGWFQGSGNMLPTAVTEVLEQLIKVLTGVALAVYFRHDLALAVASTLFAVTVSEAACALFAFVLYVGARGRRPLYRERSVSRRNILKFTVPLTFTAMAMPLSQLAESIVAVNLMRAVTPEATALYGVFSEEEIEAAYDENVAADEANYADPYQFENAFMNGTTIYYTPEGYRNVKHILFKFDDEQAARYDELSTRLADLEAEQLAAVEAAEATPAPEATGTATDETATAAPTEAPRAITEIEADIAETNADLDALYAELMPEAESAIERFNAGEDIDALIAELSDDNMPESGYAVSETAEASLQAWDPAFTAGALSVEEVGGLSAPVRGVYGIHLIYYAGDITPGATALEDVHDEVEAQTLQAKISETYGAQIDAWKTELNLVTYPENLA